MAEQTNVATSGELMVLRAVREGANTKKKIYKHFGAGAAREQVDAFADRAVAKGFASVSGNKYLLTNNGLEEVLRYEIVRPVIQGAKVSTKEIIVDKAVGGGIMAAGFSFIYTGFKLAMDVFNTQTQGISTTPSISISPTSGLDIGSALLGPINQLFSNYITVGFKLAGALLVVYIGSIIVMRGIQLFRR